MTQFRATAAIAGCLVSALLISGCASNFAGPPVPVSLPGTSAPYLGATGPNVLPVSVGGSTLCGKSGAPNELCTSVTICVPGTTQCQTIGDILVDTGSVGLRVFSSVVTLPLAQQTVSGNQPLAECASFGVGSDWGPVVQAGVQLGGEPAVVTPIQLINSTYASVPAQCAQADVSPTAAGFNGILGIGLFDQDCGTFCATDPTSQFYYFCPTSGSGSCSPITLPVAQQLQSPVALLPVDNNGSLIALAGVPTLGSAQVSGQLILGIGTSSNNVPQSVIPFVADTSGSFVATLNNVSYGGSFVDSGSNGLYFPNDIGLNPCPAGSSTDGFYCTGFTIGLSAFTFAADSSTVTQVPFQVADANALLASGNVAFNDLAGTSSGGFDFGLPFFYGRAVFTAIENSSSSLGVGPLWAY